MAHVDHFNKQSVRNIIKEHERDTDHYKNDVDVSRSDLNFGYGYQTADDMALNIQARCNDIMQGKKMQEQTNVMSEWKVTYPSWLCDEVKGQNGKKYNKPRDEKHVKLFFDTVYNFTVERYGSDNVMGGYVHMDETTPHIHIDLVPEATSRKTGKRTVSSASLFNKTELQNYQRDLQKEMVKVFGKDANSYILNGRTKGNYTIDELKERTRVSRKQKAREKAITDKERELDERDTSLTTEFLDIVGDITGYEYDPEQITIDEVKNDLRAFRDSLLEREERVDDMLEDAERFFNKGQEYRDTAKKYYHQEQEWLSQENIKHIQDENRKNEQKKQQADAERERIRKMQEQRKKDKENEARINELMAEWGEYVEQAEDDTQYQ